MTKLMVRCKNCRFKFPSFTQINEVAFETAAPSNNAEECPGCREMLAYIRKTIFLNSYSEKIEEVYKYLVSYDSETKLLNQTTH